MWLRRIWPVVALTLSSVALAQDKHQAPPTPALDLPFVAGKRWAIVVGANAYESYGKLKYAAADAKALAKMLIERYRFSPDTVKLLTDDADPTATPTAGHIVGEVESILSDKRLDKSDLFVFFFAGHGQATPKGDFLLPTDARKETVERVGLPVSELIDRFAKAGLKNVLIAVDACRSGNENRFGEQLEKLGRETKIAVMLGCEPGGRSYESTPHRHGFFTYFLLEALKNEQLREETSGALWVSSVAKWVREKVGTDTERVFGESRGKAGLESADVPKAQRQIPSAWTSKTEDVLLGAFPPAGHGLEAFFKKAGELDKDAYISALVSLADTLAGAGKWDSAVELLKTAEGLGPLGDYAAVLFGAALMNVDRYKEADGVLTKLKDSPSGSYWQQIAILYWSHIHNSPDLGIATAEKLWQKYRDKGSGSLYFFQLLYNADDNRKLALLHQLARLQDLNERERHAIDGGIAYYEKRYAAAAEALTKAVNCKGTLPSDADLITLLTGSLTASRTLSGGMAAISMLDKMIAQSRAVGTCHLWKGAILKYIGNTSGAKKEFAAALKNIRYPGKDFFEILSWSEGYTSLIADDIIEASSKYELSWTAQLSAFFARMSQGQKLSTAMPLLIRAKTLYGEGIGFWEEVYTFAGQVDSQYVMPATVDIVRLCAMQILGKAGDIQGSRRAWEVLLAGLPTQLAQIGYLLGRYPPSFAGIAIDRQALAEELVSFCAENGDDAAIAQWLAKFASLELVSPRMRRIYALYLATAKRDFKAVADLRKQIPDKDDYFDPMLDALVAAGQGDAKQADKLLKKLDDTLKQHRMVRLLCSVLLKREGADEALRKAVRGEERCYRFFIDAAVYGEALRSLREKPDKDIWEAIYQVAANHPSSGNVREWFFGREPKLEEFAGTLKMRITVFTETDIHSGSATLNFLSSGDVNGAVEAEGGAVGVLSGNYDKFGNLAATLRIAGKQVQVFAKLLPTRLPDGITERPAQLFILVDEAAEQAVWYGRLIKD